MTRIFLLLLALNVLPARAEWPHPLNWFKRMRASRSEAERLKYLDPVWRSARVPLMDVRSCAGQPACVLINGRKVELDPTPTDLWHQRVQVIGVARGAQFTNVFAKVRFSAWTASEPDFLLVWAAIRNQTRKVQITGYSIDRDEQLGLEYQPPVDFTDFSFMKYLTSRNPLETEVARELVERRIFCVNYPAEPLDTIRDEVAPLQRLGFVTDAESNQRLIALQSVAGVLDIARGEMMCDSPITDHVDAVLEQVRNALEGYAHKLPVPTVAKRAPKVEMVPKVTAPPNPSEPNS